MRTAAKAAWLLTRAFLTVTAAFYAVGLTIRTLRGFTLLADPHNLHALYTVATALTQLQ